MSRYWGFISHVEYFPEGQGEELPVARINVSASNEQSVFDESSAAYFTSIEQRRTDRALFDGQPLTTSERSVLRKIEDARIARIEDKDRLLAIANVLEKATYDTLSRGPFKRELSQWVRSDWSKKPAGMPGYAMGMPAPISLVSKWLVRYAHIHKQEGPKTKKQIMSSSVIAAIWRIFDKFNIFPYLSAISARQFCGAEEFL